MPSWTDWMKAIYVQFAGAKRRFAPWNLARLHRLGRIASGTDLQTPLPQGFRPREPAGTGAAAPAVAGLATRHRTHATLLADADGRR